MCESRSRRGRKKISQFYEVNITQMKHRLPLPYFLLRDSTSHDSSLLAEESVPSISHRESSIYWSNRFCREEEEDQMKRLFGACLSGDCGCYQAATFELIRSCMRNNWKRDFFHNILLAWAFHKHFSSIFLIPAFAYLMIIYFLNIFSSPFLGNWIFYRFSLRREGVTVTRTSVGWRMLVVSSTSLKKKNLDWKKHFRAIFESQVSKGFHVGLSQSDKNIN